MYLSAMSTFSSTYEPPSPKCCLRPILLSMLTRMTSYFKYYDARTSSPSDRIYACACQFTMNLHYAFNNCAFARVRTEHWAYLRDQLRV